jgi:hypothetical protein
VVKAGIHYAGGRKQRWLCKNCGRIFITPFPKKLDLEQLVQALREYGAKRAVLFGSHARGEAGPGSDVDLLVEFSKPVGLLGLLRIQRELSKTLGVKIDLGTKLDSFIKKEVTKDAKVILR